MIVHYDDGNMVKVDGNTLDQSISSMIFSRNGRIKRIEVSLPG
jgi:hypothetical protein